MSRVFICYNRDRQEAASAIADDVKALGHDTWFDQELSGGQAWWNEILANIRDTDLFVIALAPETLNSVACTREYGYAEDLGKPIIPVLVSDGVSTSLLPPALSVIQFVDYRVQDRDAALRLARAFSNAPTPPPLPDPLPAPPEVPISYLGGLRKQIDGTSTLGYAEQSALLLDLKRSLRNPATADDARVLLVSFSKRRDLLATIANEIGEILPPAEEPVEDKQKATPSAEVSNHPAPAEEPAENRESITVRELLSEAGFPPTHNMLFGAIIGGVLGILLGVMAMTTYPARSPLWGLLPGVGAAVAGALGWKRPLVITLALLGAGIGFFILYGSNIESEGIISFATVFGASTGFAVGAVLGFIINLYKNRTQFLRAWNLW